MSAGDANQILYKGLNPFVRHTSRHVILLGSLHVSLLQYADKGTHYRLENMFKL
jgi:hypothetical protein